MNGRRGEGGRQQECGIDADEPALVEVAEEAAQDRDVTLARCRAADDRLSLDVLGAPPHSGALYELLKC